jgi:predicted metal-dependent phosphoesterase TrpH
MIDLHTHSKASDGTYSPGELLRYAAKKNIKTLALTDHDTTSGLLEAQEEARIQGITFVPGIELTIDWPTGEFHMLGLGLQRTSPELKDTILFLRQERRNRNLKMSEKLKDFGIHVDYDELVEKFQTENIGRPHFAQVMVEKGYIKTRQEAFDRYFASGRPCYVNRVGEDLAKAVQAVKSSGGVPVQAHPLSMYVSWGKMEETMNDIHEKGVMGLEAWHSGIRIAEAERLEKLARKFGMIVTGGSDFHGEKVRADRRIGITAGKRPVEERLWEDELKPMLEKIHGDPSLEFEG